MLVKILRSLKILGLIALLQCVLTSSLMADVYIKLTAVNATEDPKEKEIKSYLPKELKVDDILDTAGLQLDYDVNEGAYYVFGKVNLEPKETKNIKIRVKDVWKVEPEKIDELKKQIDSGVEHVKNTEYAVTAEARKKALENRLNFIVEQQNTAAESVEKRIDNYRTYSEDIEAIRNNALSVTYWRTKAPDEEAGTIKMVIDLENPTDQPKVANSPYYLPPEVKPENIVDYQGFEIKFDGLKRQSYLVKNEELQPGEKKKYEIRLTDIWRINQTDIENLKDRSRKTYDLLKKTEYAQDAEYLIANIKKNLQAVEDSQAISKPIKEHISSYRINKKLYESAEKDVKALEDLLQAVRENLERSIVKNVLQRIKSLKSLADISKAIFGEKPSIKDVFKWITWVIIFVAVLTGIHFMIWGRRSADAKKKQQAAAPPEEKKTP